jgi:hypothetical protein
LTVVPVLAHASGFTTTLRQKQEPHPKQLECGYFIHVCGFGVTLVFLVPGTFSTAKMENSIPGA